MDTISLQNTKTLEKVFTNELQQKKALRYNRQNLLLSILIMSAVLLVLYVATPLFSIIQ